MHGADISILRPPSIETRVRSKPLSAAVWLESPRKIANTSAPPLLLLFF